MSSNPTARRPLKSRNTAWAAYFSRGMLKLGLAPNSVSMLSILFAAVSGAATLLATRFEPAWIFWLISAAGIQMRLFCNLMDGLLAIEGGLKTATGEMYNEIPDRIDDALILVPLGYAGGTPETIALGWAAAFGAVFTAYIRSMFTTHTGKGDYCGPMAKPHRMAAATLGCFGMIALDLFNSTWPLLLWCLLVINAGIIVTLIRRMVHLAAALKLPKAKS